MFRRWRQDDIAPKSPPPPPSRLAQAKAASNARGLANQAEAAAAEERIQNHPDVLAKKAELERMVYEWAARLRFKINRIELNWGQYGSDFGREYSAFVIASSGDTGTNIRQQAAHPF